MRAWMQVAWRTRRLVYRLLRVRTRGVKVMLFNPGGEILLVRNSYGATDLFVLPGGGIGRSETPAQAAAREVGEEVGLEVEELSFVSTHFSTAEGKRDTVFLFAGRTGGVPVIDGREVEEAAFFAVDALPKHVSLAALRRLGEYRTGQAPDPQW